MGVGVGVADEMLPSITPLFFVTHALAILCLSLELSPPSHSPLTLTQRSSPLPPSPSSFSHSLPLSGALEVILSLCVNFIGPKGENIAITPNAIERMQDHVRTYSEPSPPIQFLQAPFSILPP